MWSTVTRQLGIHLSVSVKEVCAILLCNYKNVFFSFSVRKGMEKMQVDVDTNDCF